jgi:hypothetical protein
MGKKLEVWLPDDWIDISAENPDGPTTVCWNVPEASGAFQLSTAEYRGGAEPRPTEEDLIALAIEFGEQRGLGHMAHSFSGKCVMGVFGAAVFLRTNEMSSDEPAYQQIWYLSNGLDFVLATFVAMLEPDEKELADAQRIAEGINFQ